MQPTDLFKTYNRFGVKIDMVGQLSTVENKVIQSLSPSVLGDGQVRGQLFSTDFKSGVSGWAIYPDGSVEFNNGVFRGTLEANSIDIPNSTNPNSFHVDSNGNSWWGSTTLANAPASITSAGKATFVGSTIMQQFIVSSAGAVTAGRPVMILEDGTVATASGYESFAEYRVIGIAYDSGNPSDTIRVIRGGSYTTTGLTPGSFYGVSQTYSAQTTFSQSLSNASTDMNNVVGQTFQPTKTFLSSVAVVMSSPLGAGTYNFTLKIYNGVPGVGTLRRTISTSVTLPGAGTFIVTTNLVSSGDYISCTPGTQWSYEYTSATPGELLVYYQNTDVYSGGNLYIGGVSQPTFDGRFTIGERLGDGTISTNFGLGSFSPAVKIGIATSTTNLEMVSLPIQSL